MTNILFDGAAAPLGLSVHSLFALIPIVFWLSRKLSAGKSASRWLLIAAVIVFASINGIALWDQVRVRGLAQHCDLQQTRGFITKVWVIESGKLDFASGSLRNKSTISEGFDVGSERFVWNRNDSFSPATFSNQSDPHSVFFEGQFVEVSWFIDPAADNTRRIVRLAVHPS